MSDCQLIYVSRAIPNLDPVALFDIRNKAHAFNRTQGITGAMCLAFGRFIQILEGKPEAVNQLFCKIVSDPRHEKVMLLEYRRNTAPVFNTWAMKVINLEEKYVKENSLLVKYNEFGKFEPEIWPCEKVVSFMSDLIRILPGVGE